ncbi:MAG: hypothetical protein JJT77_03065 [Crocinitomicaceae bacterium]|nr:hypothetical protein [Crocinitomicaceae bacterium]
MSKWIQIVLLMVLGTFLFSSSGIVLHKHYCSKDGVTISWKPINNHQCQHKEKENTPSTCSTSCCAQTEKSANNKVPNVEKSCCYDELNVLSLDIDLGMNNVTFIVDCDLPFFENNIKFIELTNLTPIAFPQRPPPLLSADYLALLQQYLI